MSLCVSNKESTMTTNNNNNNNQVSHNQECPCCGSHCTGPELASVALGVELKEEDEFMVLECRVCGHVE
jgi:hypothetical protein